MIRFVKRYKWYFIATLMAYAAVSIWLLLSTNIPQRVPFEYQVF